MSTTIDFSGMRRGTRIGAEHIGVCAKCGRKGRAHHTGTSTVEVVHKVRILTFGSARVALSITDICKYNEDGIAAGTVLRMRGSRQRTQTPGERLIPVAVPDFKTLAMYGSRDR